MEDNEQNNYALVEKKPSFWSSFKSFWLQPVVVELTPHQQKVFKEVHDFWTSDIVYHDKGLYLEKRADNVQKEQDDDDPDVKISL